METNPFLDAYGTSRAGPRNVSCPSRWKVAEARWNQLGEPRIPRPSVNICELAVCTGRSTPSGNMCVKLATLVVEQPAHEEPRLLLVP